MTGQELQAKREELGLTTAELAERLGVAITQIESWEAQDIACRDFPALLQRAMSDLADEIATERFSERESFDHAEYDREVAQRRAQTAAANKFLEESRRRTGIAEDQSAFD
ncbi:MAG TPA: helix-turn-helix transcriptional regulator [Blastocatellia bacterium]|nr:helix-turn-helix transcriptional regulator [Blastocatellia bacterium]